MLVSKFAGSPVLAWLEKQTWHPWLVVGLVCIGAFAGQLDATIVQLALPTLGRTFNAPLQQVSWVALSYLLAFAAFLPIFGRLCQMFGRKDLYVVGYLIFVAASALCAMASDFWQLLAFRLLQGMGGSLLGANSIAILVKTIQPEARGRALGYFAAAQAVGMSAGPAIGGVILASLGWRWIFWITVPFGIVAAAIGWLALPRDVAAAREQRFDWGGALLIGPALILAITILNQAADWGLGSVRSLVSAGACVILFALAIRHERATRWPLVDPRLFQSAGFRYGAVAVALAYAILYGTFFIMSFALEHGYAESPVEAGFRLALIPVAIGLSAPLSSDIRRWIGSTNIGVAAMLCCLSAIVILVLTDSLIAHHRLYHSCAFILFGVGLGVFIAPNNDTTISAVPPELSSAAGSLLNLLRALGTSVGVASAATTLSWRLHAEAGPFATSLTAGDAAILAAVRQSLPLLAILAVLAAFGARMATSPRPEVGVR
jgi:EmrB/QacA subfamily drug resistance transporter